MTDSVSLLTSAGLRTSKSGRNPLSSSVRSKPSLVRSIGTINGFKHLPATFTPGRREGPPLSEVMADWQARLDAEPAPENLRAAEGAL